MCRVYSRIDACTDTHAATFSVELADLSVLVREIAPTGLVRSPVVESV